MMMINPPPAAVLLMIATLLDLLEEMIYIKQCDYEFGGLFTLGSQLYLHDWLLSRSVTYR